MTVAPTQPSRVLLDNVRHAEHERRVDHHLDPLIADASEATQPMLKELRETIRAAGAKAIGAAVGGTRALPTDAIGHSHVTVLAICATTPHQRRDRSVSTPSPLRSDRAGSRPVMARISEAAGPLTSSPSPTVQSTSVARRQSPALRCLP